MAELPEIAPEAPEVPEAGQAALGTGHHKRSRVLLNCAPCRASKLKCDRCAPCSNCRRKDRIDLCTYAPRPKKPEKQAKNMATRLRRLEGMLREMIADDGRSAMSSFGKALHPDTSPKKEEKVRTVEAGRVVKGERSMTYVGATHFMAMLDDIEDLKSYFEEPSEEPSETLADASVAAAAAAAEDISPDAMMLGSGRGWSKEDLLAVMPSRSAVDPLIVRYFGSNTPSSHTIHRPTFAKQYSAFWQDPSSAEVDWLGVLYGMLALGVHYAWLAGTATATAAMDDSRRSLVEQFRLYRTATTAALATQRLANPSVRTIQALLMLEEAEFLVNRASQTNCWLLSAVCIRLMLHMGMHRDPSRLSNISAFDGEMRRRMWNLAIQLDLIVSFHLGLPSMIHGIPSDTSLPHNLLDEDFGPDSLELPQARPDSEYTAMSYPIFKSVVCRVFGQVARLSHTLTPPSYADVMHTDALLLDKWQQIPEFMKVRPLADALFDPPLQIVQRFGIASLFQKSRCVLHRPYLAVPAADAATVPRPEHAYSRRTCLQAALELLRYHEAIYEATQPNGILHKIGWFVTGLGMHDYLLAAMIVYLVVQNEALFEDELIVDDQTGMKTGMATGPSTTGSGSTSTGNTSWTPSTASAHALPIARSKLVDLLVRSYRLWASLATNHHEVKKAADLLELMVSKIQTGHEHDVDMDNDSFTTGQLNIEPAVPPVEMPSLSDISLNGPTTTTVDSFLDTPLSYGQLDLSTSPLSTADMPTNFSRRDLVPATTMAPDGYDSWIPLSLEALDWDSVDNGLRANSSHPTDWIDPSTTDDIHYLATGSWNQPGGL